MFWQKYSSLCDSVGKSPSRVAAELGLSNSTASGWKRGAVPQGRVLRMIADYFAVPIDYLTTDGPNGNTEENTLLDLFRSFNHEGRGKLLDYAVAMKRSGKYEDTTDYFLQGFDMEE